MSRGMIPADLCRIQWVADARIVLNSHHRSQGRHSRRVCGQDCASG
jgi:hypothetical protein